MDEKIYVPPIKIQGIKTKLVPFIKENILLKQDTVWIEPFMGSGVVGFNVRPERAIFADVNPHIINFYKAIQDKNINSYIVRGFLEEQGKLLKERDAEYYYEVRERFNKEHSPLDFLFLNRSCFNGMIRFNKDYKFNVPYGHKPERFSKAYITKIVNQVKYIEEIMYDSNWLFLCQSFDKTLEAVNSEDCFVYCDPPYIGRHVDYYDSWTLESELKLKKMLYKMNCNFMLSTWDYNEFRKNEYIDSVWGFCKKINKEHYYHIGANEKNRNPMIEALLVNYQIENHKDEQVSFSKQMSFAFE